MYELFSKKDNIELVILSDLHLCNKLDRIDLLYKAYEYTYQNNIKYVINLGDLFDSDMPHNKYSVKTKSLDEQIDYVANNYPRCDEIKTIILYGNHDYYSKIKYKKDIVEEFSKIRKDLIHLKYGEDYLNIKNNYIKLQHEIDILKNYKKNIETYITLLGHYHKYRVDIRDDSIYIFSPALAKLKSMENIPSILHVKIDFTNELFSNIRIKCIDMEQDKMISDFNIGINVKEKKYQKIKSELKKL